MGMAQNGKDFAKPSPENQRVDGADLIEIVDDLDDIYDALPAAPELTNHPFEHRESAKTYIPSLQNNRLPGLPGLGTDTHAQEAVREKVKQDLRDPPLKPVAQPEDSDGEGHGGGEAEEAENAFETIHSPAEERSQEEIGMRKHILNSEALITVETTSKPEVGDKKLALAAEGLHKSEEVEGIGLLQKPDLTHEFDQMHDVDTSLDSNEEKLVDPRPLHDSRQSSEFQQLQQHSRLHEPAPLDTTTVASITEPRISEILHPSTISSNEPSVSMPVNEQTFEIIAEANKANTEAEFELDSSPFESSDLDTSEDSISSDSDDDEFEMLDAEEQARRLMGEDGGSDEEGEGKGNKTAGPIRTLNEKPDEIIVKPDVVITDDMNIEELGNVEIVVENVVVVKAKTSGEYQVLDFGSVLCLENKKVIGSVAETLGRVQQPFYSVRFTNAAAISEAGISANTRIFYVEKHSTYIFTQPLKACKGSDASNIHDEEVGDDELEFSDDEAEAEHRRRLKLQRQSRREGRDGNADGFTRGPQGTRGRGRGGRHRGVPPPRLQALPPMHERPPGIEPALNYDDKDGLDLKERPDSDELYTPLTRPANLHEMMGMKEAPAEANMRSTSSIRGNGGRGRSMYHRGHNRGQGRGRGLLASSRDAVNQHSQANEFAQSNGFPPPPTQHPPSSQDSYQFGHVPTQQSTQGYTPGHYAPSSSTMYPPTFSYSPQGHTQSFPQQYHNTLQYQSQSHKQQMHSNFSQPPNYQTPHQQSVYTPVPSNLPPGAHINPAFFQQTQNPFPSSWQQGNGYGDNR